MRFRRGSGTRHLFQTKQFALSLDVQNNTAAPGFFANDVIIVSADTLFGISNTVQPIMKKIVVVGIEYYFDAVVIAAADTPGQVIMFNYLGLYKDTLDSASVPDSSGQMFLSVDQVSGTTNQQLFPERVIDRRSFTCVWDKTNFPLQYVSLAMPGMMQARVVRRRLSLTTREALIARIECFLPASPTSAVNEMQAQVYGVITYRVDL